MDTLRARIVGAPRSTHLHCTITWLRPYSPNRATRMTRFDSTTSLFHLHRFRYLIHLHRHHRPDSPDPCFLDHCSTAPDLLTQPPDSNPPASPSCPGHTSSIRPGNASSLLAPAANLNLNLILRRPAQSFLYRTTDSPGFGFLRVHLGSRPGYTLRTARVTSTPSPPCPLPCYWSGSARLDHTGTADWNAAVRSNPQPLLETLLRRTALTYSSPLLVSHPLCFSTLTSRLYPFHSTNNLSHTTPSHSPQIAGRESLR